MAVSAAIAAALAAKYPHLAADAAGAEPLRLVEQVQTVRGVTKVIARFRKYRVGNQVVGLDEPAEPAPVVAPVAKVEAAPDADVTPVPVAEPAPVAPAHAPASAGHGAHATGGHEAPHHKKK